MVGLCPFLASKERIGLVGGVGREGGVKLSVCLLAALSQPQI